MRDTAVPAEPNAEDRSREVLRFPAFAFFWSTTTVRAFGSAISGVTFQVLVVTSSVGGNVNAGCFSSSRMVTIGHD